MKYCYHKSSAIERKVLIFVGIVHLMGSLEHALVALPLDGLIGWEGAKIKDLSHFEWNLIKKNFSYNPHEFRWGNCDFNELIFFEDDLEMLTFELKNELLQA